MKLSHRKLTITLTLLTALLLSASVSFVSVGTLAQKGGRRPLLILTHNGEVVAKVIGPKAANDVHCVWAGPGVPEAGGYCYWTKNGKEMPKSRFQFGSNINDIHFSPTGRVPRLPPIPAPSGANDVEIRWDEDGRITEAWWTRDGQRLDRIALSSDAQEISLQFNPQRGQTTQSTATGQLVGLVYDKDSRPGQPATVSLTTDPKKYENIPALGVIEMNVPANAGATAQDVLHGLVVDLGDGRQQPANQPLTTQIGQGATSIPVKINFQGNATPAFQGSVPITQGQPNITVMNTGKASDFTTPPVCQDASFIRGPLSGNGNVTRITVDNQSATIIAESPTTVYFDLPPGAAAGPHQLIVQDGARSSSFPILRMGITGHIDQPSLLRGQKTNFSVTVNFGQLPDSVWQHGGGMSPELVNASQIQQVAQGFRFPRAGEPGVVFLSVSNGSPGIVTIKPVMLALHQEDFRNNQFTSGGEVQSLRSGGFTLNLLAQAFFAPIPGQEIGGGVISGGPVTPTATVDGNFCKEKLYKRYKANEFKRADSSDAKKLTVTHATAGGGGENVYYHCQVNDTYSTTFTVTKDDGTQDIIQVNCSP